jgi:hypothetical protein
LPNKNIEVKSIVSRGTVSISWNEAANVLSLNVHNGPPIDLDLEEFYAGLILVTDKLPVMNHVDKKILLPIVSRKGKELAHKVMDRRHEVWEEIPISAVNIGDTISEGTVDGKVTSIETFTHVNPSMNTYTFHLNNGCSVIRFNDHTNIDHTVQIRKPY